MTYCLTLRWRTIFVFLGGFIAASIVSAKTQTIELTVLSTSSQQRAVYAKHEADFENKHKNTDLVIKFLSDAKFKQALRQWLQNGAGPDLFTWQAGMRLSELAADGKLKNISEFWIENGLDDVFNKAAIEAVKVDTEVFAVPSSYYQWGLYYRQSVFDDLNIETPKTWAQLIQTCRVMLDKGMIPITIGAQNKWTTAAWFDYINLRINGLDFHHELLSGQHDFTSDKVKQVFVKWKELVDAGCFTKYHKELDWAQAMPLLYHKIAGITLIGNFFASSLPPTLIDDFRFTPFPIIDENMPLYEEAPLDLYVVPYYANLTSELKEVLLSLSTPEFLTQLNEAATMIAPLENQTKTSKNYFISEGQNLLHEAKGVAQFFDRDTNSAMANEATAIFTDFLSHKNIEQVTTELESARKKHLVSQ